MSATTRHQIFSAVHTIGGLLPADMLVRISEGKDVPGCAPSDYRVIGSRSVRDDAERHWDYLRSIWTELREKLPVAPEAETPADPTGLARSQWLEPLFDELGFGRLAPVGAVGITSDDGTKTFPISHRWNHVPLHLITWNAKLDSRPGGHGTVPPQSLLQECLNRTEAQLWGVLTNGRQLRLLRDSNALATASYVEFDLEAIFDGELFSEFVLLYRLLHVSRFDLADSAALSTCWLEKWRLEAIESGTRALDHHRDGVQNAITTLGTGFLRHPANGQLRQDFDADAFHTALLRLVYQLIFLFVAEDRDVLHPRGTDADVRQRYAAYFSSTRLRQQAQRRRGTTHSDLYLTLRIVLNALADENGRSELGLPGLGGLFDETEQALPLSRLALANADLLEAVRHLSRVRDVTSARWRQVDYRNMGAEELGSIYESLLELVPKYSAVDGTFELVNRLGNDRKTTGSYYTPSSLIEVLLDSTLDPVIDAAQRRGEEKSSADGSSDPAESIVGELLALTVCDPACGSGHFLVAAARRIAKRVAAVRERNPEPTLDAVRQALHEVIARCIYGVDLNPMALELAKVSLWMEAMEPGKALGFLDAHIKRGNSLIGAAPALIRAGIPDRAFKSVEGDNEIHARSLEQRNSTERGEQMGLFDLPGQIRVSNATFADAVRTIFQDPADSLGEVRRQAARYRSWADSGAYRHAEHVADAWCAAFFWTKDVDAPPPVTHAVFTALQDATASAATEETHQEIIRLRTQYSFFHWHLAFPEIFTVPEEDTDTGVNPATGWSGGFSAVLGNPPWDKIDFEDKKYFSVVNPSIAATSGVARRVRIAEWMEENATAGETYRAARRMVKSTFNFASGSGSFPLCARGLSVKGVNSLAIDQLFAERFTSIVGPEGRIGCIVPTVIATGASAQHLFSDLSRRGAVTALYDFENRKQMFAGAHSSSKFCLLSLTGYRLGEPAAKFAFFLEDTTDLEDTDRVFTLSPEEITLINPNTGTLPIFRSRRDADLTASIYHRVPVLWNESERKGNPWMISFKRLFDMTDDSDLFRTHEDLIATGWILEGNVFIRDKERMVPLYEAKMVDFYNHRAADVVLSPTAVSRQNQPRYLSSTELRDAERLAVPLHWIQMHGEVPAERNGRMVKVSGVEKRLAAVHWDHDWLCGWCDVTASTNARTAIPAFVPRVAVGHKFPLMLPRVSPELAATLVAAQSSLVFDFVSRQKIGSTSMGLFIWKQLPVPTPDDLSHHIPFIIPRVLELTYTAVDMGGLASDLGNPGCMPPFRWDEERRPKIRAELDAYFFHLYGIDRADVDYILETFQTETGGLKNNDIAKYGTYRTKDLVLDAYDRMAPTGVSLEKALVDGENYVSLLDPPPGHGPRHPAVSA